MPTDVRLCPLRQGSWVHPLPIYRWCRYWYAVFSRSCARGFGSALCSLSVDGLFRGQFVIPLLLTAVLRVFIYVKGCCGLLIQLTCQYGR